MKVKVRFFTVLRELTGKRESVLDFPKVVTVGELIEHLAEIHGQKFRSYVYDSKGKIKEHLQFLVNGYNIDAMNGLETMLKDGDTVAIIPPIGGG